MASLKSIILMRCPKCEKGQLFPNKNPFSLFSIGKMNTKCSHCDLSFEKEPGFYFGAMYISYALNVALFVGLVLLDATFLKSSLSTFHFFVIYFSCLAVLYGFIFRFSRAIWANFAL